MNQFHFAPHPPRSWIGIRAHIPRLISATVVIGCLGALAAPAAKAQLVKINDTTLFSNGFEADTVGMQPANPTIGAWAQLEPGNPERLGVYGPASGGPGAKVGNNYLHGFRPDDPSNLYMLIDVPALVDGDKLYLETWLWYDDIPKDYGFFAQFESPNFMSYVTIASTSAQSGSVPGGYRLLTRGGNLGADLADLAFLPETWHKWSMEYVVGSNEVTLGLDDMTQVRPMDAGDLVANPFTRLRIASSNFPTTLYFDGPGDPIVAIPGDVNNDGFVDIFDVNVVSANWGSPGGPTGDANGDGNVDIFDVNLISANWSPPPAPGGAAAVPEPASLVLLGLAGLIGLSRIGSRRR